MRRFLLFVLAVFALFGALVAWGASLPDTQRIEVSATLDRDADALFDTLDNLSTYPFWSHHVPAKNALAFGQMSGTGASAAWNRGNGFSVGSAEILQSVPPELVTLLMQNGERSRVLTYVLARSDTIDAARTLIVAREEADVGGFPFFDRIKARFGEASHADAMLRSMEALENATPADPTPASPEG